MLFGKARVIFELADIIVEDSIDSLSRVHLERIRSQGVNVHVQNAERIEECNKNFDFQFGIQDELDLLLKELVEGFVDLLDVDG